MAIAEGEFKEQHGKQSASGTQMDIRTEKTAKTFPVICKYDKASWHWK